MCRRCLLLFILLAVVSPVRSGVFEFSGDANGPDVVSHPTGYSGAGRNLIVTVGIAPSSPHAAEMVVSVQNVINTWNSLISTVGNVKINNISRQQFDFESVALHELGHCIGLAHPNLASESGLTGVDKDYTQATKGANNKFDLDSGADGIIGSSDDLRGDDINLHWFLKENNNPFVLAEVIDNTTYSRHLTDLPLGDLFVANADRIVSTFLGAQNTEAVMQQGILAGESRRTLSADDVATLRLAMSGLDMTAGTADDYTLTLRYEGFTDSADIVFDFDDMSTFAACRIRGTFLPRNQNHITITSGHISINTSFAWFFNDEITPALEQVSPQPNILANGFPVSTVLASDDHLSLVVALNPGLSDGDLADYWIWAHTPIGDFWLNNQLQFVRSDAPIRVFGGPLLNLSSFSILDSTTTGLPSGVYSVFFAVDDNQDGVFNATFQDEVEFTITP